MAIKIGPTTPPPGPIQDPGPPTPPSPPPVEPAPEPTSPEPTASPSETEPTPPPPPFDPYAPEYVPPTPSRGEESTPEEPTTPEVPTVPVTEDVPSTPATEDSAPPIPFDPYAPEYVPPSDTPSDTVPTVPDQPGGQTATLSDGTVVYIEGSTMRDTLGFETQEQYGLAQQRGQTYGPLAGGDAAVQAVAIEHGISESEARRLITLAWETRGNAPELQTLTPEQKQSLLAAGVGYDPWAIAPESIKAGEALPSGASGQLTQFALTREEQLRKMESQEAAAEVLRQEGLLRGDGTISPEAFISDSAEVRQALYDIGLSGGYVSQMRESVAALKEADPELYNLALTDPEKYEQEVTQRQKVAEEARIAYEEWMSQFTEQELAEIQSGEYKVYVPDPTDPENVNKGQWVPSTKEAYDQQQKAIEMGIGPRALGEIASGKYLVPDAQGNMIPTTRDFFETYQQAQEAKQEIQQFAQDKGVSPNDFVSLYNAGMSVDTLREAYPGNDEYFDGIERTLAALKDYTTEQRKEGTYLLGVDQPFPTEFVPDVVAALAAGAVTDEQLKELGYDPDFVDNTQQYVRQLSDLVSKFDKGLGDIPGADQTSYTQADRPGWQAYREAGGKLSPDQWAVAGRPSSPDVQIPEDFFNLTGSEAVDLGTAIREAGFDIQGGSAAYTWRNMTDEQKYQVAEVLAGYPKLGHPIVSTVRSLQSIATDEDLSTIAKVALEVLTAPVTAILNPFTKEMTVGELQDKLEPYAIKDETSGTVIGYDLSAYMAENPYDAPLLVRGGFKPEAVEKAQEAGSKIVTQPQGATPLDWAVAGVMAASVALPMVKPAAMSLFGPGKVLHGLTAGHAVRSAVLTDIVVGAGLAQSGIKWGLPIGMTILDVANWKDWTPEQRIVAGAFTGLTYIPVLGALWKYGSSLARGAKTVVTPGGILSRGTTTGYQDVYPVRVPKPFDVQPGVTETQLANIFRKSPSSQVSEYAAVLVPEASAAFLGVNATRAPLTQLAKDVEQFMNKGVDFTKTDGISPQAAQALMDFSRQNASQFRWEGSQKEAAYGVPNISPGDFDGVATGTKSVAELNNELVATLQAHGVNARVEGQNVYIGNVKVEIKPAGKYAPLGFGWEKYRDNSTHLIDGVPYGALGNQFLDRGQVVVAPGIKEYSGLMGPVEGVHDATLPKKDFPWARVGTHEGRVKDYNYLDWSTQYVLDLAKKHGKLSKAQAIENQLKPYYEYLDARESGTVVGSASPEAIAEAKVIEAELFDLVRGVQKQSLETGQSVSLVDPRTGLVLTKVVSPIGEVLPGTLWFVTDNYVVDLQSLQNTGRWGPTEDIVFFSPEAAYKRLHARYGKDIPDTAGIVAVRTVPSVDISPGGLLEGPFRFEELPTDAFSGLNERVIYGELTSRAKQGFTVVEPNIYSRSGKGVAKGITAESFVYDPVTGKKLPIIWTATDAAAAQKLGAPTRLQEVAINEMAITEAVGDLLHPHVARITFTEPSQTQVLGGLIEWYRPTYEWSESTPQELAKLVDEKIVQYRKQAEQALVSRNTPLTPENIWQEVLDQSRQRIMNNVRQLAQQRGVEVPEDVEGFIQNILQELPSYKAVGELGNLDTQSIPSVEKLREVIGNLDTTTRNKVISDAQRGYDDARQSVLEELGTEAARTRGSLGTTGKQLYYINLGKLSTKLATAAVTTSILTATAPAIAGTLIPPTKSAPGELTSDIPVTTSEPVLTSPDQVEVIETPTGLFETPGEPVITPPTTEIVEITTPETPPPTVPETPPPPTGETPIPPPETPPPPDTPPPPPSKPTRVILPGGEVKAVETVSIPPGSIAWRQGTVFGKEQIKYIPPPYDVQKPISLIGKQPEGWRELGRTPEETIQVIGESEAEVPKVISVDLGVVDVFIYEGQRIEFKGGGEETNVGTRIDEPTMGMSVPAEQPTPLKYGTTFQEAVAYVPHSEAQREFIEDRIAEQMSKMSTDELAAEIKAAEVSEERQKQLLSHIPDKQREVVREKMKPKYFARVGKGFQFAETSRRPITPTSKGKNKGLAEKLADEEANELYTKDEIREMRTQGLSKLKPGARNSKVRGQKASTAEQLVAEIFSNKGLEDL